MLVLALIKNSTLGEDDRRQHPRAPRHHAANADAAAAASFVVVVVVVFGAATFSLRRLLTRLRSSTTCSSFLVFFLEFVISGAQGLKKVKGLQKWLVLVCVCLCPRAAKTDSRAPLESQLMGKRCRRSPPPKFKSLFSLNKSLFLVNFLSFTTRQRNNWDNQGVGRVLCVFV